jgi:hypothetical protein
MKTESEYNKEGWVMPKGIASYQIPEHRCFSADTSGTCEICGAIRKSEGVR